MIFQFRLENDGCGLCWTARATLGVAMAPKGAAFVLPFCNTAGMSHHLAEISRIVSPRGQTAPKMLVNAVRCSCGAEGSVPRRVRATARGSSASFCSRSCRTR